MEDLLDALAEGVALFAEAVAVLVVALGAAQAAVGVARLIGRRREASHGEKKDLWRRFGMWLLLGLEFELAADIVRSVITPSWADVGKLAAIAVVRTFLNYFLDKDLERSVHPERVPGTAE